MHLTRYHGVFAPHSRWRAAITPAGWGSGTRALDIRTPAERHRAMSWAQQIAETPGNPRLYLERGEAYDMLGRDDEALADYDRGFAAVGGVSPPKRGQPMALRGVIKLERGDIAGATADFDTAIANDPDDPAGWYWRGEPTSSPGWRHWCRNRESI